MLVQQFLLESDNSKLTCWLEPIVKPGFKVTLKNSDEPERWWTVKKAYNVKDLADIKGAHNSAKWHENDFHGRLKGLQVFK